MIEFRKATPDDARLLFDWRTDPVTQAASKSTDSIVFSDHVAWLAASMDDPNRALFIAEIDGAPVGTTRADLDGTVTEISWTVAPNCRGQGIGSRMVSEFIQTIEGTVVAEIKSQNIALIRIAEAAGLKLVRQADGMCFFARNN